MKKIRLLMISLVLIFSLGLVDQNFINTNHSVSAKTKIKKHKNGKLKQKNVYTTYTKQQVKKYKLGSNIKKQTLTKYNKKGQLTYKKITKVTVGDQYNKYVIKEVKVYKNYKKINGKYNYTYKSRTPYIKNWKTKKYKKERFYLTTYFTNNRKIKKLHDDYYVKGKLDERQIKEYKQDRSYILKIYYAKKGKLKLSGYYQYDKNGKYVKDLRK